METQPNTEQSILEYHKTNLLIFPNVAVNNINVTIYKLYKKAAEILKQKK